jgi:hypothetical protein
MTAKKLACGLLPTYNSDNSFNLWFAGSLGLSLSVHTILEETSLGAAAFQDRQAAA